MTLLDKIEQAAPAARKINVPDGWRTIFQIQKEEAPTRSLESVRNLLHVGIKAGVVEMKKFNAPYRNTVRRLNCYREIKK